MARAPTGLTTTLDELLTALQEAVSPEEDALVVVTMWYLLQSGRLTWRGEGRQEGVWVSRREEQPARQRGAPL